MVWLCGSLSQPSRSAFQLRPMPGDRICSAAPGFAPSQQHTRTKSCQSAPATHFGCVFVCRAPKCRGKVHSLHSSSSVSGRWTCTPTLHPIKRRDRHAGRLAEMWISRVQIHSTLLRGRWVPCIGMPGLQGDIPNVFVAAWLDNSVLWIS
jgi:hypothetical protein